MQTHWVKLTWKTNASYGQTEVEWITTSEAAVILGITPVRVRQLIGTGQLRAEKRGRDYILIRSEVEQFNREGRRSGGRPRTRPRSKHLRVR